MRDQLDMIIEQEDCEYSDIVCEYSPIKLRFIKSEKYITSKNNFISWAI